MNLLCVVSVIRHIPAILSICSIITKNTSTKKKEKQKNTGDDAEADTDASSFAGDELEEVVFVLKTDNTVEKKTVKTGIQDINNIEIVSGLKGDEQVVTGPYADLKENLRTGKKVKVVTKEQLFAK